MKAQRQSISWQGLAARTVFEMAVSSVTASFFVAGLLFVFFAAGCDGSAPTKEEEMSDQDESTPSATSQTFYEG